MWGASTDERQGYTQRQVLGVATLILWEDSALPSHRSGFKFYLSPNFNMCELGHMVSPL